MASRSVSDTKETQAGASVGGAGAGYQSSGAETISDIGQAEANIRALIADRNQWDANQKALFDDNREAHRRLATLAETALANSVAHSANIQSVNQSEREETLRIGKLAGDRIWNINETDAFAVLLNKVVAEAVKSAIRDE